VLTQTPDGRILVDDTEFGSWQEYVNSDFFREHELRCGTRPQLAGGLAPAASTLGPADCTFSFTNPAPQYDPSLVKYRIPVVVHVIRRDDGVTGHVPESLVQSQIDILNEDYLAMAGTNGENGTDIQIEFYLATEDPSGNPTTGITYSDNSTWFSDGGSYWDSLAWDTNRYMNVYTNSASGNLGYVPNLPQGGIVGFNSDRVVILWSSFGRDAPIGPPYDQGRTLTHEVGHYLGLYHPFDGCDTPTTCYSAGDHVCDTTPQDSPTFGCSDNHTCGEPDNIRNYMDYSNDLCMELFTPEQARRMRCTLENYRPDLYDVVANDCGNGQLDDGEQCDTAIPAGQPGACPTECDTADPCVTAQLLDAGTCDARCEFDTVTSFISGDGCCPEGGNAVKDNDCPAECGNSVCEPGELETCLSDCQCIDDDECDDDYVCTFDACVDGFCSFTHGLYGDVDFNGHANLFDIFCVVRGAAGQLSADCPERRLDIAPCSGDGVINLVDVFAVLDAISGTDPCCSP
jgi:hypothetical protein